MRQILEHIKSNPVIVEQLAPIFDARDWFYRAAASSARSTSRKRSTPWLGIAIAAVLFLPPIEAAGQCTGTVQKGCNHNGSVCTIPSTKKPGVCVTGGNFGKLNCSCGTPVKIGGPSPVQSDYFNVISALRDPNNFLYNPGWSSQLPGDLSFVPETTLCHNFSSAGGPDLALGAAVSVSSGLLDALGSVVFLPLGALGSTGFIAGQGEEFVPLLKPDFADCTVQALPSNVDTPSYPNRLVCEQGEIIYGLKSFTGHVNWFPVTVEGQSHCCDHSNTPPFGDDDYTFGFESDQPNDHSLSVNYPDHPYGLHVEFNSEEVIDNFSQSREWRDLQTQINQDKDKAETEYQGHTILTGMFGLDGEHDLKAELHPLYAMAVRPDRLQYDPNQEVWMIFVRNRGNEGYCSSQMWDAGFEDYTFHLPWKSGSDSVEVDWSKGKTSFWASPGAAGPSVTVVQGENTATLGRSGDAGVYVKFHLGPAQGTSDSDASDPVIFGALYLDWKGMENAPPNLTGGHSNPVKTVGGTVATASTGSTTGAATPPKEEDDVEDRLAAAMAKLTPAQRDQIRKAGALAVSHPLALHQVASTGPAKVLKELPAEEKKGEVAPVHAISAGPAVRKIAREKAQMQALCEATKNAPPGLPPSVCNKNMPNDAPPATKPPEVKMPDAKMPVHQ